MNNTEARTLWISIGCALFAVFLLYSYSQEQKAKYDAQFGSLKSVVVATKDINEMETIDDTKIDLKSRPVEFIDPGAIAEKDLVVGQVAGTPIKQGEQITKTRLLEPGPLTGIARQVAPGKRAVAIPVDDIRGVAKLLHPGDRVDLVAAMDYGKGNDQKREVRTLLQDVPVLATGLRVINNIPRIFEFETNGKDIGQLNLTKDTRFTTITIEVAPREAQELIYILSTSPGSLFLTLRNPNDRLFQKLPISNIESVLGKPMKDLVVESFRSPATRDPGPSTGPSSSKSITPPKKKGPFVDL